MLFALPDALDLRFRIVEFRVFFSRCIVAILQLAIFKPTTQGIPKHKSWNRKEAPSLDHAMMPKERNVAGIATVVLSLSSGVV